MLEDGVSHCYTLLRRFNMKNMKLLSSLLRVVGRQPFSNTAVRYAMTSSPLHHSYYNDRFYPIRSAVDLPRDLKFKDGKTMTINYAEKAEVTSSLNSFLRSASERGDNVGTDEFVGSTADALVDYSFIFTARPKAIKGQSDITAFIVIGPSKFARTLDPCLADIHVIRTRDMTDATYTELVDLSVKLARELDVGYTDCILEVSVSCDTLLNVLTNRYQFTAVGTVPKSVHMANGIGLVDSTILVKNIATSDCRREPRSLNDVLSMLAKHELLNGPNDDAKYERATLPSVTFLPQKYFFRKANLDLTMRNMYKGEDRALFDLMNSSRERGEGIAVNDRPNLAYFRHVMLTKGWCIVFEDRTMDANIIVGFLYICQSRLTRSQQAKAAQGLLVLGKQFQDRGLGREIVFLMHAISKQIGFTNMINFYFANNVRSQHTLKDARGAFVNIGVVPRSAYVVGAGWQDLVLRYQELTNHMQFVEFVEEKQ